MKHLPAEFALKKLPMAAVASEVTMAAVASVVTTAPLANEVTMAVDVLRGLQVVWAYEGTTALCMDQFGVRTRRRVVGIAGPRLTAGRRSTFPARQGNSRSVPPSEQLLFVTTRTDPFVSICMHPDWHT